MRRVGRTALSPFLSLACGLYLFPQNSFADMLIESEAGLENSERVRVGLEVSGGVFKAPDDETILRIKRAPIGVSVCMYFACVKPVLEFSFIDIELNESSVSAKMNSQTDGGEALRNLVLGGTFNLTAPPAALGGIRWLQFGAFLDGRITVLRTPLNLDELNIGSTDMLARWPGSITVDYRWSTLSGGGFVNLRAPWLVFSAAGGAVNLDLDVEVSARDADGKAIALPNDAQGRHIEETKPLALLRLGVPLGELLGLNVSGIIIPYKGDIIYTIEGGVAFRI